MGEQVAGAAGYGWLDGVRSDLESEGYAINGVDIPACSVNAPHIRSRLYWIASNMEDATGNGRQQRRDTTGFEIQGECSKRGRELAPSRIMAQPISIRWDSNSGQTRGWESQITWGGQTNYWHEAIWLNGADGKTRRAQPDICLLAHGVPARVGKLRAYGNAIVPPLAAEVIKAFMESK
jgi:DNA (cytosine-5)-methyltransferase 1